MLIIMLGLLVPETILNTHRHLFAEGLSRDETSRSLRQTDRFVQCHTRSRTKKIGEGLADSL